MAFHFIQFDVEDERSTQRVGTDAMLLGAWACPPSEGKILDIGTGCGVLALMMAQKTEAIIEAMDIDLSSVNEAHGNFCRSVCIIKTICCCRCCNNNNRAFPVAPE